MKAFVLVGCFYIFSGISASVNNSIIDEWELFKNKYNKSYNSKTEESFRKGLFVKNKRYIARHNERFGTGEETYTLAMNEFGDMLPGEIYKTTDAYEAMEKRNNFIPFVPPANATIPKSINWRERGAVTKVKNQLRCGSCWSFSATGALEGQHFLKTKKLISLSEQNLVDCSYENNGCGGGYKEKALLYVINNKGIDTERSYPYEAKKGECRYNERHIGTTARNITYITPGNEEHLKIAVAIAGPVAISIDARKSFAFYKKGVYREKACSKKTTNHAMLIVGYDDEKGDKYWLVKNSHGTNWGMQGYIKIARDDGNVCGIAKSPMYPIM